MQIGITVEQEFDFELEYFFQALLIYQLVKEIRKSSWFGSSNIKIRNGS